MKPESRAAQARQADLVLRRLLRTPKTRPGLIAAVTSRMISRRFVFGFLADQTRQGVLTVLKSGTSVTYQIKPAGAEIAERPSYSGYPSWLDPRSVPPVRHTKVFIDGRLVKSSKQKQQK